MATDTLARFQAIVADELGDPSITLDRATVADDVPFWDSLAHIRIMVAAEKAFGIRFDSEELNELPDVGAVVDAIDRRVASGG